MSKTYRLRPLDEIIPPLYYAFILGFPCPSSRTENALSVLRDGWAKTLTDIPIIAGEIYRDNSKNVRPGSLKVEVSGLEAMELIVNDMTLPGSTWKYTYDNLRAEGVPLSQIDGKIFAPLVSGLGSISKVATVQVNFIPGGCLLSLCSSHSVIDAGSNAVILRRWAEHCRDAQVLPHDRISGVNPVELEFIHPALKHEEHDANFDQLKSRPELWHLLGLHATENLNFVSCATPVREFSHLPAALSPLDEPMKSASIFAINAKSLQGLKDNVAGSDSLKWISSNDALVALLWRSIMKARFPHDLTDAKQLSQESIVTVAVDGRKLFSPPVPITYIGNVVLCCMTRLPLNVLCSPETSLAQIAAIIRLNVEEAKKPQVLQDAVRLASGIPNVANLKIAFSDFGGIDLITTSWVELPFYSLDFGPIFGQTGKPEFVRIPRGQFGGICSLQPRQLNGDIEVNIVLQVDQMKRLRNDEDFVKWVSFVSE